MTPRVGHELTMRGDGLNAREYEVLLDGRRLDWVQRCEIVYAVDGSPVSAQITLMLRDLVREPKRVTA